MYTDKLKNLFEEYGLDQVENRYIYGLGTTGRLLADICRENKICIKGIVVGNNCHDISEYNGYKVISLDEYLTECNQSVLLYTVKNSALYVDIKQKCEALDFSSVDFYSRSLEYWYDVFFYKNFERVKFEKNYIFFDGLKIIDPRIVKKSEWSCFLQEIGDIILPELFDDYSRIDEGSYYLGNVHVNEGDIVVDAGANLGVFSALATYLLDKTRSYAFEPLSANYNYLIKQAEMSNGRIIPVNKALDAKSGEAYVTCAGSSSSMFFDDREIAKEKISCITLDEFMEIENTKIDFIKADIEGAECNMIKGAVRVLKECAPKLSICTYHRPTDKQELTDLILAANPYYKIEYKWKKLYAHI